MCSIQYYYCDVTDDISVKGSDTPEEESKLPQKIHNWIVKLGLDKVCMNRVRSVLHN